MPLRDGWARVVGRSERYGLSAEIDRALALFGLTLPVEPKDVKTRWRTLALEHHPDRNPDSAPATRKMTEINQAFEILTGINPETLSYSTEDTGKTHFVQTTPMKVAEAGGITIEMYGGVPQDWVYAASFAASDGGARGCSRTHRRAGSQKSERRNRGAQKAQRPTVTLNTYTHLFEGDLNDVMDRLEAYAATESRPERVLGEVVDLPNTAQNPL